MDISLFTTENSSANENVCNQQNFIYHFQHKSNNIIDIQE